MKFKVLRKPAWSKVTVEGAIQPFHTKVIRDSINKLIDNGFSNIIVDLSPAIQPLRSVNFTAISQLFVYSRLAGGVSIVVAPGEKFLSRLANTGLEAFIHIVKTPDLALHCLLSSIPKRYDGAFFQQLLDKHILTQPQLKEIINEYKSQKEGKLFGTILMEKNLLQVDQLLDILAVSMGLEEKNRLADESTDTPQGLITARFDNVNPPPTPTSSLDSVDTSYEEAEYDSEDDLSEMLPLSTTPSAPSHVSEFVTKQLFGDILVEQGLITEDQLRTAINIKNERQGARLGDILIEQGFIGTNEVFSALQSQIRRKKASSSDVADTYKESSVKVTAASSPLISEFVKPTLFGEILLELGLVTEDGLRMALDVQRNNPEKQLGNILIELGAVSPQAILRAVEEQANRQGR
jgi:anti-anti-sigma regulatory factor